MAVIGQIRKHSGWIVAAIGVAILGFVVQDGLGNRQGKVPALAEIGGERVSYSAFEQEVEKITEQYKRSQGEDVSITPEDLSQIRSMAWERILSNTLLSKACTRLDLRVTTEEMNDMYYGQFISPLLYNYFVNQNTGQYDRQQVMSIISNYGQLSEQDKTTLGELEKVVKEERLKEKYYYMVAKGYYIPKALAQEIISQQSDKAVSRYACLPYSDIEDKDAKVGEADYKKFYEENKYLFKQEKASRDIDFVVWDVVPTAQDMMNIEETVANTFAEFQQEEDVVSFAMSTSTGRFDSIYKSRNEVEAGWDSLFFSAAPGSYFAPRRIGRTYQMAKLMDVQMRADSTKVSHIIIGYKQQNQQQQQQGPQRTKEQAKSLADSLRGVAAANTANFAQLAASFSDDANAKQNGGDMGWQLDGGVVTPAFRELTNAITRGSVGEVKVVESPYGYHVLYINGKTSPKKKVLACVISTPIEPSNATTKDAFVKASRFLAQATDNESFDSACVKNNVVARHATYVDELAEQLPGINSAREVVRWAYKKETKKGAVSHEVFEMENRYVVASLKAIHKKGFLSLEDVKAIPQVEYRVMRDVKAALLLAKAEKAKGATTIEQVSQKLGVEASMPEEITFGSYVFGTRGYEPALIGTVFGMKAGSISAPVKGNSGIYILSLESMNKGIEAMPIEMVRMQMNQTFLQKVTNVVKTALQEDYKVVDNRAFFF